MHHPFTAPLPKEKALLGFGSFTEVPFANSCDWFLNGMELGSGSIRIHERSLREKSLPRWANPRRGTKEKFGFLLEAFEYGTPPTVALL